jgi:hypothetical protein
MQNVINNGVQKTIVWQHCNEAQVKVHPEFPGRLV